MSHIPNKPTIIAAALYGASTQLENGKNKLAWSELTPAQAQPFAAAAEFLSGQTFGATIQRADRAKLAEGLAKLDLDGVDADADLLISIFISVASALTES